MPTPPANLSFALAQAQLAASKFSTIDVLRAGAVLIVIVLIGAVVILVIRSRLLRNESSNMATGFTLHDLRAMRDRGELTESEYAAAHAKMVARLKENTAKRTAAATPATPLAPETDDPTPPT